MNKSSKSNKKENIYLYLYLFFIFIFVLKVLLARDTTVTSCLLITPDWTAVQMFPSNR